MINDKYITLAVMINYILNSIDDTFDYKKELEKLFEKYPNIDLREMGFKNNWQDLIVWNNKGKK